MTEGHTAAAVALALAAAASFAVSNVAQMDAVRRGEADHEGRPDAIEVAVVIRVARDPVWIAGLATSIIGFVFEAIALSIAPVILVQPMIVAELPFALPLAAFVAGRSLGRREWTGISLVTAGLAALVAIIRPSDTPIVAPGHVWLILFLSVGAAVVAMVAFSHRASGILRTSGLAAAAGATFGLLSVVTKAATHQFVDHGAGAVASWQPWALGAIGFIGLSLSQNAYRAGPLAVSLPLLDIGEPLAASLIAALAFGERIGSLGVVSSAVLAAAALSIAAGVAVLDRSPLVQASSAAVAPQAALTRS